MSCSSPTCCNGIDLDGDVECRECGGAGDEEMKEIGMGLLTVELAVIALCAVVVTAERVIKFVRKAMRPAYPPDLPTMKYQAVYTPLACSVPTKWNGLTEPCCRRRGHPTGRCISEVEIEHMAEHGPPATLVPVEPVEEFNDKTDA